MLARAQGCLLGQLAGDSLGGLVEFQTARAIRAAYPNGLHELLDGGTWNTLAGQPTDDSEMALMLARMLARDRRYQPSAALDAYVHWWPRAWDHGTTLSQALGAALRGKSNVERMSLAEENASRTSQSNGSLMRISPLGIFGVGRAGAAAEWSRQDSRLTHPHVVCQEACAVFVTAIATAIGDGGPPEQCYDAALIEARRTANADVIAALERAREYAPADYERQMGWVLIALQNAFYQLLHAANLEDGVCDTVLRGGDTDTNAAIAGALLGAVHGRRAIPDRWLHGLLSCRPLPGSGTAHPQPSEFWPVDALDLAEAVLAAAVLTT
jgi:ADP-ribosylglycohydrolase